MCLICTETVPSGYRAAMLPCGHHSMCYRCALECCIALRGDCPFCRGPTTLVVTVEEPFTVGHARTAREQQASEPAAARVAGAAGAEAAAEVTLTEITEVAEPAVLVFRVNGPTTDDVLLPYAPG